MLRSLIWKLHARLHENAFVAYANTKMNSKSFSVNIYNYCSWTVVDPILFPKAIHGTISFKSNRMNFERVNLRMRHTYTLKSILYIFNCRKDFSDSNFQWIWNATYLFCQHSMIPESVFETVLVLCASQFWPTMIWATLSSLSIVAVFSLISPTNRYTHTERTKQQQIFQPLFLFYWPRVDRYCKVDAICYCRRKVLSVCIFIIPHRQIGCGSISYKPPWTIQQTISPSN